MNQKQRDLLLIVFAAFAILYGILLLPFSGVVKFALGMVGMFLVGELLIRRYKFHGGYGIILFKSKCGLKLIQYLAVYKNFWNFFIEVGAVIAYGAFSFILFKKMPSLKAAISGFIALSIIMFVVAPFVIPFLASAVGINVDEKPLKKSVSTNNDSFPILPLLLLYGGGMFIVLFSSVVLYGLVILVALQNSLFLGTTKMSTVSPGVAPLLPGINLPFFEGVIALLVILVVHEGAHAILARIARIPILSSGIAFFGVIPVGAFVEPDEEMLKKTAREPQTAVLVAGSTANFITAILFFILFIAFIYFAKPWYLSGKFPLLVFEQWWMNFVYTTLGLVFSLNFALGSVNLLPMPFFDGYRVLEANIKNKNIVNLLMVITAVAFLVNILPWFFR